MDDYEVEPTPFYFNPFTSVALFKGFSLTRNRLSVVVKHHDFKFIQQKAQQIRIVQTLNAALAQAKVQHPNSCDILEVQMKIKDTNCVIYHILEALEGDLGQDIELRKRSNRPYEEGELRQVLQQIASALATAHDKRIAHRDVKPSNIFKTANNYKLGDFGCFFEKRDSSITQSAVGDSRYMSPQMREACIKGSKYNAFKADVFALGASIFHMATLTSPDTLLNSEPLDEAVGREIEALPCSAQFKQLLCGMLSSQEDSRLKMSDICSALAEESKSLFQPRNRLKINPGRVKFLHLARFTEPHYQRVSQEGLTKKTSPPLSARSPSQLTTPLSNKLVGVEKNQAFLYEIQSQRLTKHILSVDFNDGGGYVEWDRDKLLCVGARPPSSAVYLLEISSFQLSSMPSLSTPRAYAGVAKMNAVFYVFGGYYASYQALCSCEKIKVSDKLWTPINSMIRPRSSFTPCQFRSLFYLVAAVEPTVETFNPETDTFTVLPVSLPSDLRPHTSVSFVIDGELCLLTGDRQIALWKIECAQSFRTLNIDRGVCSRQQPLIDETLVLISCKERIQRFSLETYSFLEDIV